MIVGKKLKVESGKLKVKVVKGHAPVSIQANYCYVRLDDC